ncbi:MAG TPA: transketolase [bacterium]|jgi:transketolase
MSSALDQLSINTIRTLSIDTVQKAKSGHPGLPLGAAAMGYVIWTKFLRHNPHDPQWINRDRFVLSAGHGCALLYSLLHLTGYDLTMDDLQNFRQWGSRTPGHPEANHGTAGVEATTGPLGQGVGNMVGMAIAREHLAATFNAQGREVIDFHIYGICSDGDMMEGVQSEAASLAGHLGLGSIVLLYDDNNISLDGPTAMSFSEDVSKRYEAYGWHVQSIDGMDPDAVETAIKAAVAQTSKPSLICCKTIIGFGSPNKANSQKAHGSPLGDEEVMLTKRALGWPEDKKFYIPDEALKNFRSAVDRGAKLQNDWTAKVDAARSGSAGFREQWDNFWARKLPADWETHLPSWSSKDKPIATRKASEKVIHQLAPILPAMFGGSADLHESNLTYIEGGGDFEKGNYKGRNLRFGVREHAMTAILNGIALTAPYLAFGSTFLNFVDYMKPSIRLAALTKLPVIYVFTHDSIGLGEDGPTHQPVEQLWMMRATPNLWVMRPADPNETAQCWKLAIEREDGPTALALTRQNVDTLDPALYGPLKVERGGYVLAEASGRTPQLILMATGSEVGLALKAREQLEANGIATRVVSMPCLKLFDAQPQEYRDSVLPPFIKARVAIETGATCGWWKYTGLDGDVIGLDRFGASAPGEIVMEKLGFNVPNVVQRSRMVLDKVRPAVEENA